MHHYDLEAKAWSKQRNHHDSPSLKKACVQPFVGKSMFTVFCDQCDEVMIFFLSKGTTITWIYYALLNMLTL